MTNTGSNATRTATRYGGLYFRTRPGTDGQLQTENEYFELIAAVQVSEGLPHLRI